MQKIELIALWLKEVWENEDASAIHKMMDKSGKAQGLGLRNPAGPDEFEMFHGAMLNLIENLSISIDMSFEKEDWICVFSTLNADNKKTKEKVIMSGCASVRIEDGKIKEAYNHWDFMPFFEQLKLLPEGTFIKCISGESLK